MSVDRELEERSEADEEEQTHPPMDTISYRNQRDVISGSQPTNVVKKELKFGIDSILRKSVPSNSTGEIIDRINMLLSNVLYFLIVNIDDIMILYISMYMTALLIYFFFVNMIKSEQPCSHKSP